MRDYFRFLGLSLLSFFIIFSANFLKAQESAPQIRIIESLEFREVDIKDVLRQLAKQYNLNIVFSETVKGLITVQLNNISVDAALDSIITVNGFTYIRKDQVIKVMAPEEASREGKQTKLITLNNADALKLKDSLKKVLSPEGAIDVDSRSNSLIITDNPVVITTIEGMIPNLDKITPQVLIETRLIETSLTTSEKLGVEWSTTVKATGAKRPTTVPFAPKGDGWMRDISPTFVPGSTGFPAGHLNAFPYAAAADFSFGTLDFSSFKATMDFLKSRTDSKLVANPRIVTLNNQKATINVGTSYPIPTFERNETTGNMQISGWSEKEKVGVNLEVIPQVSPDGHIKLKLKPEVSSFVEWVQIEGNNAAPVTTVRTAETEVLIKDGETVVIGGLVKNKTQDKRVKVPILGDIPILNLFFASRQLGAGTDPDEKTDLLIFVTARIIKESGEPLIAWERGLITSPPHPFKLEKRQIK